MAYDIMRDRPDVTVAQALAAVQYYFSGGSGGAALPGLTTPPAAPAPSATPAPAELNPLLKMVYEVMAGYHVSFEQAAQMIQDFFRTTGNTGTSGSPSSAYYTPPGFPPAANPLVQMVYDIMKQNPGMSYDQAAAEVAKFPFDKFGENYRPPAPPGYAWAFNPLTGTYEITDTTPLDPTAPLEGWKWVLTDPTDPTTGQWKFFPSRDILDDPYKGVPPAVLPWLQAALQAGGDRNVVPEGPARAWVQFLMAQAGREKQPGQIEFGLGVPGFGTPESPLPAPAPSPAPAPGAAPTPPAPAPTPPAPTTPPVSGTPPAPTPAPTPAPGPSTFTLADLMSRVGARTGDPTYDATMDLDHSGMISLSDVLAFNAMSGAPTAPAAPVTAPPAPTPPIATATAPASTPASVVPAPPLGPDETFGEPLGYAEGGTQVVTEPSFIAPVSDPTKPKAFLGENYQPEAVNITPLTDRPFDPITNPGAYSDYMNYLIQNGYLSYSAPPPPSATNGGSNYAPPSPFTGAIPPPPMDLATSPELTAPTGGPSVPPASTMPVPTAQPGAVPYTGNQAIGVRRAQEQIDRARARGADTSYLESRRNFGRPAGVGQRVVEGGSGSFKADMKKVKAYLKSQGVNVDDPDLGISVGSKGTVKTYSKAALKSALSNLTGKKKSSSKSSSPAKKNESKTVAKKAEAKKAEPKKTESKKEPAKKSESKSSSKEKPSSKSTFTGSVSKKKKSKK